jgi:hypothetical protein
VAFVRLFRFLEGNVGGVTKVTRRGERVVLVEVASREASLRLQGLKTLCGCAVTVTPHGVLQQRKGVISSWDLLMDSEEDILGELRSDGVRDVRRLKKRSGGETGPSPTLLLTFEGELPKKVRVGCLSIRVRPYVQDPLRCYKCLRFGHTQARCFRGRAVCSRCGEEGHLGKSCKQAPRCTNCGGEHSAFSGACPVVVRERAIQRVMATQRRSYAEAARSYVAGEGCAGTPGGGGQPTATAGTRAGLGSAGSGASELKAMVAAPAGRSAPSPSVGAQMDGTGVEMRKACMRSVGTQTGALGHTRPVGTPRSVETQTEPPTGVHVKENWVQTAICRRGVWWPHRQRYIEHLMYKSRRTGDWTAIDQNYYDCLLEKEELEQMEEENSGQEEGEEEEEEEPPVEEKDACAAAQSRRGWSPVRPPLK